MKRLLATLIPILLLQGLARSDEAFNADNADDVYTLADSVSEGASADGFTAAFTNALISATFYEPDSNQIQENNQEYDSPSMTSTQIVSHAIQENKVSVLTNLAKWKEGKGEGKGSEALKEFKELFSKEKVTEFMDKFNTDTQEFHPQDTQFQTNLTSSAKRKLMDVCGYQNELQACINQPVFHPITLPIVFHVFGFRSGNQLQPASAFSNNAIYFNAVHKANQIHADSGTPIRFQIAQIRLATNPSYTYLMLNNVQEYQNMFLSERLSQLAQTYDVQRTVNLNIYVVGDLRLPGFPPNRGIAWAYVASKWTQYVPSNPIAISYGLLDPAGDNNAQNHFAGPKSLAHEIGHHLGLHHTSQGGCVGTGDCAADTGPTNGQAVWNQPWGQQASSFCVQYPQARSMHIPMTFSSCAGTGLPDPIFNVMTYVYAWCRREFSVDQWKRMYCTTQTWRPALFARGRQGIAARDEQAPGQIAEQTTKFPCEEKCGGVQKTCQCDRDCVRRNDCCLFYQDSCMADGACCWNKDANRYIMFNQKDHIKHSSYFKKMGQKELDKWCVPILYQGGALACPKVTNCQFVEADQIDDNQVSCYDGNIYRSKCFAKESGIEVDGCELEK